MQDSNLLSYKRQIYSLMCITRCTDSRYMRCRSPPFYIYAPVMAIVSLPGAQFRFISFPALRCPGLFMAAVTPARPRHMLRCYPAACSAGLAGNNLCPVSGALKGGGKMKLIFLHYYFTTDLKLFRPRKVRIFQRFAGFAEKSLKKI